MPLSEKTVEQYMGRIAMLTDPDGLDLDPYTPDVTIPAIMAMKKSLSTRHGYLVALRYAVLKDEKVTKVYGDKITEVSKERNAISLKQEMSETDKEKYGDTYPTWESILETVKTIKADTTVSDSDKLLLDLYTMLPPVRLDYINFKLYKKQPKEDTGNYAVIRRKDPYIKLNDHKTAKAYGAIKMDITKPLYESFTTYMDAHRTQKTLWNIGDYVMSKKITGLFMKAINKPYSVNTLRHAYESYRQCNDLPLTEKLKDCKAMGHNLLTSATYRRT